MKKLFVILIVALLGLQSTKAQQKYKPIMPYNVENGHSIAEVKSFVAENTDLSNCWTNEMLKIVRDGSGESVSQDAIFTRLHKRWRKYGKYVNSHQTSDGNCITFYNDENWEGYVWVYEHNGISIDLYKDICINLLKIPVVSKKPASTNTITTPNGQLTIENNIYVDNSSNNSSNNSIDHSANNDNTNSQAGSEGTASFPPVENYGYPPEIRQRSLNVSVGANFDFSRRPLQQQRQIWRQPQRRQQINPWVNPNKGLKRIPNDANGHPWVNPNHGLIRIPNDADGHGWNQTTSTGNSGNTGNGRHPNN